MMNGQKVISAQDHQSVVSYYENISIYPNNVAEVYNKIASQYDRILESIDYSGYQYVSKKLLKCFTGIDLHSKVILDVGAGSGILGESLSEKGFTQIHALDMSQNLLDKAKTKEVYSDLFCASITTEPTPNIQNDTYDAVVSSGSFFPNHIKVEALKELARITKCGGFIIINLHDPKFQMDYMNKLGDIMKDKTLELISMKLIPYKREYTENYKLKYAYLITLKVLMKN